MLPAKQREIHPPAEGWKDHTYYTVLVSFRPENPIHTAIFYSGFVHGEQPGNYHAIWSPLYERKYQLRDAHYLKVISVIDMPEEPK